ncbi:MAG TPA: tetratricopeptide repeat protein [Chthoniobacterales bacterium]|nr:tetratricopeptide repeat protein [Chthoniobacterales bacterium]
MGGSAVRRERRAREQAERRARKKAAAVAPVQTVEARRPFRFWIVGALLLVASVVFAYQPAWNAGYIWDDDMYVTHNPLLTAADGWGRIWFSFDAPSQYFPLTYTTFRIEHAIWGLNASGYHWVNILLHAANALLLWRLLRVLDVPAAWFGAALFALHPVQVESVAWITERKNVLMGLFFLASLLAWVRFLDEKPKRTYWWLALSFVLYVLSLSAKTTACTLPAALVLILWWQRKPITAERWLHIAPYVLAGIAAGIISILWERSHPGYRAEFLPMGLIERVLMGSRAIWFYLSKLAWPTELMFSYPRWDISRADATDYLWPILLLLLIGAIIYARRWLGRGPEVAFVFFVATLSPLLGVVMVTTFLYSFVADHYQYIACIGPLALFAAGAARVVRPPLAYAGAALVLATLGALTWQQTKMYQNEETLWLRTIAQNPESWMARNNLAGYWVTQKRFDEAIEQYRTLIEQRPDDPLGYQNLGVALARKGDPAAAVEHYQRALALQPHTPRTEHNLAQALVALGRNDEAIRHFERALALRKSRRGLEAQTAELHVELATVLLKQGATDEARRHFEEAQKLNPGAVQNADVYINLGNAALQKREFTSAVSNYRQALAIRPNDPEAHSNLATALLLQGNIADALKEFEATLALAPQSVPTLNNFARLLASAPDPALRDADRAARLARQAIDFSGGRDPASFRALAAALAAKGEFAEAEKAIDRAIDLASSNPAFVDALRREKDAYRAAQDSGR